MRRVIRSVLVGLLVTTLIISPATACHRGWYGGGRYYASNYYASNHCGGYYQSGWYRCGDGDHRGYVDSCCGGVVVVRDCGGCSDCGASGESMQEHSPAHDQPLMPVPKPPAREPEHSTVNRPTMEPEQTLPPQLMPSTSGSEMHSTPPVELPTPVEETTTPAPAAEPITPPTDLGDDLFSAPPAVETPAVEKPLPVEEPATPAEADDFFSTPAATPADEPSTAPTDDDLFGPSSDQKPADEATPPADEAAPPADEKKTEDDDLFGKSPAILAVPGGLASRELRRWVDDTGMFSCRGRLVRVLDGKVQLLKDTGRTATVPMNRLSQSDFRFVTRQASAQQAEAISKTAQASTGWSN